MRCTQRQAERQHQTGGSGSRPQLQGNNQAFPQLGAVVLQQDEDVGNDNESCLDQLDNLWLTSCHPNNGRDFEMTEYLCDELGEDGSIDDEEINKTVNDWIMAHAPFSWGMTGERLSIESVKEKLR